MKCFIKTCSFLILCFLLRPIQVEAQFSMASDGISASGRASVEVKPTRVRMRATMKAIGNDARRVLEQLRLLRSEAKDKLLELKADESSITFTETSLQITQGNSQQQAMMEMMQMGMGNAGASSSSDATAEPITAVCTLNADWVIPESDNDAMILFRKRLEQKVTELDVLGESKQPDLTDKQAEMMNQMRRQSQRYGGQTSGDSTQYKFVGSITSQQQEQAMRMAVENATKSAKTLAAAAGSELGKLVRLQTAALPTAGVYFTGQSPSQFPVGDNEGVDDNPGRLAYQSTVQTTFAIAD
jgi:uncharacterized protein YggE